MRIGAARLLFLQVKGGPPRSTLFPTRRSSDLDAPATRHGRPASRRGASPDRAAAARADGRGEDRKSTRLNSSHSQISYAVFCLKKKTCGCGPYRASTVLARKIEASMLGMISRR